MYRCLDYNAKQFSLTNYKSTAGNYYDYNKNNNNNNKTVSRLMNCTFATEIDRSRWLRGIKRGPAAARFLGYGPITAPEEFY